MIKDQKTCEYWASYLLLCSSPVAILGIQPFTLWTLQCSLSVALRTEESWRIWFACWFVAGIRSFLPRCFWTRFAMWKIQVWHIFLCSSKLFALKMHAKPSRIFYVYHHHLKGFPKENKVGSSARVRMVFALPLHALKTWFQCFLCHPHPSKLWLQRAIGEMLMPGGKLGTPSRLFGQHFRAIPTLTIFWPLGASPDESRAIAWLFHIEISGRFASLIISYAGHQYILAFCSSCMVQPPT